MHNSKIKRVIFFSSVAIFVISIITVIFIRIQNGESFIFRFPGLTDDNKTVVEIKGVEFSVDLAITESQRAKGLMNVSELPLNEGMLFVYEKESPKTYWMKNVEIPLDIIFIDSNRRVVEIFKNIPPCETENCESYYCPKGVQYVLELNGGVSEENGFQMGNRVNFDLNAI